MVLVALVALNFTVLRAALDSPSATSELLSVGAMPMATVLAIGLIIGYQHHGSRPFLLGFVSFGAMALALFVVLAACFGEEVVLPYARLFIAPLAKIIGTDNAIFIPIAYSVGAVALGLPQVAFALMGGFLSRKYQITITRRPVPLSTDG
jgi:hypothetical protein